MQAKAEKNRNKPLFKKILIANRGEISCRIIRTAKRLGIRSVAVYSDADKNSKHVRMANESVRIGPAPAVESYLKIDAIIQAALDTGAEAIHPGYGFLSENAPFAERLESANLIFIGPPVSAIRAMGEKDAAKRLMEKAKVPVVPGYHGLDQDDHLLFEEAQKVKFPVLIKPVAGGGGKGMRVVLNSDEFFSKLAESRRESKASFGNSDVIIERLIQKPRHIEVQVFGDKCGQIVHLFERDCTLQRRHQKIIEECPAPSISDSFRDAICNAAVKAAQAIGYVGAGTVEFIAEGLDGLREDSFWFMEMNTRLQVEHPVTEEALGLDLVELQLQAAAGHKISIQNLPKVPQKCAMEARIYAEDPASGFLPSAGRIVQVIMPKSIRVDAGVEAGDQISPFYDPMIAKIIATGSNRSEAQARLLEGLLKTKIRGVDTNISFLTDLVRSQEFTLGNIDTTMIDLQHDKSAKQAKPPLFAQALASLGIAGLIEKQEPEKGFTLWHPQSRDVSFLLGEKVLDCQITIQSQKKFDVQLPDGFVECTHLPEGWLLNGLMVNPTIRVDEGIVHVFLKGIWKFLSVDPLDRSATSGNAENIVRAPMPGILRTILTIQGKSVSADEKLAVMEAMKMELTLTSPIKGVVAEIYVSENTQIADGANIVRIEPEESD